jgi:hypothetical protein
MYRTRAALVAAGLLALACLVAGCDEEERIAGTMLVVAPGDRLADLTDLPDTLVIDGYRLTLEADPSRDFMPICPPGGGDLSVGIFLIEVDDRPLDRELDVQSVLVVNGGLAWMASPRYHSSQSGPRSVQIWSAAGGPKWGPYILVDVIVVLESATGQQRMLVARNQEIGMSS